MQEQTQDQRWGGEREEEEERNDYFFLGFAGHILSVGPAPRQGSKTDNAHPPIHPVKYTDTLTVSISSLIMYHCYFIIKYSREMTKEYMNL